MVAEVSRYLVLDFFSQAPARPPEARGVGVKAKLHLFSRFLIKS